MTEPAYRDITPEDVAESTGRTSHRQSSLGRMRGKQGAVRGEYVKVQYLDITLNPEPTGLTMKAPTTILCFCILSMVNWLQTKLGTIRRESLCHTFFQAHQTKQLPTIRFW